ncbi:MAG: GNAT family N-acetyltransferase [Hyphomicrobiaceae bacterium TMED74]|nr:GNAT family N-acetyltransferase [Filomicrobium sp.]RPG37089.1 MAG: GNAT family N-acetyltransferase [Hyphomicrobiaceae bacterium TMED74]
MLNCSRSYDYGQLSEEGFYDLPHGMLATVVTHLEMRNRPPEKERIGNTGIQIEHSPQISVDDYRAIYRQVGEDWLWFLRMAMSDQQLTDTIHHYLVDVFRLLVDGKAAGLLELDFRANGECEIAFFGLSEDHTGRGLGSWLMSEAIEIAWSQSIARLWLHTCTFDHPGALAFYQKHGFFPFKQEIELVKDPRLDGTLPKHAAKHIPMIAKPTGWPIQSGEHCAAT